MSSAPAGSLVRRVLAHVEADPSRTAVRDHASALTRIELAERAAAVTATLRARPMGDGAGGAPVLVLPSSGPELAVMLLGAVGAGRPIVLGDLRRSEESLRTLAERTGCQEVLRDVLVGDADLADVGSWAPAESGPDDVLLLASTSGSTAEPRIVARRHAALLASVDRPDPVAGMKADDRVGRLFTIALPTVNTLARTLMLGATSSLIDPRRVPVLDVLGTFAEHGVTHLWSVPSTLRVLLRAARTRHPSGPLLPEARIVGTGGEPTTLGDLRALAAAVPRSCTLVNRYSSTEAGNIARRAVTAGEVLDRMATGTKEGDVLSGDDDALLDVGEPLPGRDVWIDAGDGRRARIGELGTVVVEGALGTSGDGIEQLADGTQRLVSGDVGFLDADGRLHLRGRSDRVVKIAGVRVALDSVEGAMRGLTGILDVAVVAEPFGPTDVRLVAHVALDDGADEDSLGPWRTELAGRVSSVAVPARLVVHGSGLPRLGGGKVDLRALMRRGRDSG